MSNYVTGSMIRMLREKRKLTQKQLADRLSVSDKTVSKWETGRGLPDVTLLEPLAESLQVSVAELLRGQLAENRNRAGNLSRSHFHVCPLCGNVIWSVGEGSYSCCGVTLPSIEPEEAEGEHRFRMEQIEYDWYITFDHPMTREHYLTFAAYVTTDRVQLVKLYPQQEAAVRFPMSGDGQLFVCCNRHGLFRMKL
jgi:transcriptional regulator with XRE-family HTH domain